MTSMPFFSIIIPALNEEKYLPLLLKDLSRQTTTNFEVIVVDGHSDDKTVQKAKEYSSKLPQLTLINSPLRNVSHQRNLGGMKAAGDYIIFMDADNRLPEYFLEGIKYKLHSTKAELFTCWCAPDSVFQSNKTIATIINMGVEASKLADNPYAMGAFIGCTRKLFLKSKGFNVKIAFAEDAEFVRRCYKKGCRYLIFRDPRFILSLRRLRSTGKLKLLQKYASLHLKNFTQIPINQEKEYPMGGGYLELTSSDRPESILGNLQQALKSIAQKPKIIQKIRSLILSEED